LLQGPAGSNLFVFHIPNDMTNRDLYNYFTAYGTLAHVGLSITRKPLAHWAFVG
jgi:CUG-BP- and ETR3-like factor